MTSHTKSFATERRWFEHAGLFGVVLLDNHDQDWAWVALAKGEVFDFACSLATESEAVVAVEEVLRRGKPATQTEALRKVDEALAKAGLTDAQWRDIMAEADRQIAHLRSRR